MDSIDQNVMQQVISALNEFHTTTDPKRSRELNNALNTLTKSEKGFMMSFHFLSFDQPTTVQHFGACIFYETLREQWERYLSNDVLVARIKKTLLEKLALGASFLNQSVTNKLTSSLAIFALYCIPDIWPEPIHDLATVWSDKPELLLRVLAELPVEFDRVHLHLEQRSILKSSLHQNAEDVIRIINIILCDEDAQPSLRNAAVECLEQWLKLPGCDLMQWQPALLPFLGNIVDKAALARILNVLSTHADLRYMENLAMDLATFLASITCVAITEQLDFLNEQYKEITNANRNDYVSELEDYGYLVSSLAGFFEITMRSLLIGCIQKRNDEVLKLLCTFFEKVSMWPGIYCYDEIISDASETFWNILKEDLLSLAASRGIDGLTSDLIADCNAFYTRLLWSAATKLAYPPQDILQQFSLEQIEKFERYRFQRVEISLNAYEIKPFECTSILVKLLDEAVKKGNIREIESVLYLFERIADYMTENDDITINEILKHSAILLSWQISDDIYAASQLGKSLMNLFYSLSHLICTGNEANKQESICIRLAVLFIDVSGSTEEALKTLDKFLESRTSHIEVIDLAVQRCYQFFINDHHCWKLRIYALRCVGLSLALHDSEDALKCLNSILAPRLSTLQMIVEGHIQTSSQSEKSLEDECAFELDVLCTLIDTQKPKANTHTNCEQSRNRNGSVVHSILWPSLPLLLDLLRNFMSSQILVEKVCDVLRSGMVAIEDNVETLFESYCDVIDFVVLKHPIAACKLAKSLILICSSKSIDDMTRKLATRMSLWFTIINESVNEFCEEYIELAYHIVKKDWKFVCISTLHGWNFLRAVRDMSLKILSSSSETNLCRKSSVLLATMIRNIMHCDKFSEVLHEAGECVINVVFNRLQTELMKSTTEALSEILMLIARIYPQETRRCLNDLPHGNAQEVVNMLKETHNAKTFKYLALQFNLKRRKDVKT
ncbi:unnamed protein product [Thelazia callipaeda]|uniref:Xpo1 domain-containing protein n=1 Tax=Thelazia callipaeda TaxID=103827 RepID=A0A158RBE8_THECL|nr:unnamed protein product [Thelazia callipaeda]